MSGGVNKLPELLTADQVAEWLRLSKKAVYSMAERGEIPTQCIVRIGPRRLRFDAAAMRAWIATCTGAQG